MKVILQNTIINAIQAVDYDGRIEITCRRRKDGVVETRTRGNGGGIQVEQKERIFGPILPAKEDGTGIGLWITKRLGTALSGGIETAGNRVDETEFAIAIPVREKDNAKGNGPAG